MKELWLPVLGFEDMYLVSNKGRIKSLHSGKVLKPRINKYGYQQLTLYRDSKKKTKVVHRLVAIAFIDNPDTLKTVNHKDLNKLNNKISNLEWMSALDNTRHAKRLGAMKGRQWGSDNFSAKLNEIDVIEMFYLYKNKNYLQRDIAELFNVSRATVCNILNGKSWRHMKNKPINNLH